MSYVHGDNHVDVVVVFVQACLREHMPAEPVLAARLARSAPLHFHATGVTRIGGGCRARSYRYHQAEMRLRCPQRPWPKTQTGLRSSRKDGAYS